MEVILAGPKVSVIIPTYRHRDFIRDTLDSVFNQTMTDYEVIVVNDGSPDDTGALLAPLVEAGRIQYVEQANQGQSRARNVGLERSAGEYIAFLDDDDTWPTDKLEWQVGFLDEHPDVGLVGGTLQSIDEHGAAGWKGAFTPNIEFDTLFAENPFLSPGQTLIRADLVKRLGGLNVLIWGADDWDLWFRIAAVSTIVMVDRLALNYRLHPGNSSKQTGRLLRASCETLEIHLHALPRSRRAERRFASHRNLYAGLAASIISKARHQLRNGEVIPALRSMRDVLPLWRGIALDPTIRRWFWNQVVFG
jgi:glycosyltransferase involved in cell wall biosynthesis